MRVTSDLQGTVVSIDVQPGSLIPAGGVLAVIESMKMHHEVLGPRACRVGEILARPGDSVHVGTELFDVTAVDDRQAAPADTEGDLGRARRPGSVRGDLAEVFERHRLGLDEARPDAVAKRHGRGHRTARENVDDLVDEGTFVEYGPTVIAAQRRRRDETDLMTNTPADGLVAGLGSVNGDLFDGREARTVVMSYDYTVLAGTQGTQNHRKKDRLFEIAERLQLPVVFFTEGGGGRPGDTDAFGVSGLDCLAFMWFAQLSGTVPLVGVTSGYCFAGNAAILGCCDVVIATDDAHIGMGGPAMIEGGGLGVYEPDAIGPVEVQRANGVIDIVVADDVEAVATARRYLSYFQGPLPDAAEPDRLLLRDAVPEDRLRAYDVRQVIRGLFDVGSVLELREAFGKGMITALARLEGRAVGVIANDPTHLAGAITSDGSDKAARFMQLCDAHGLPIVTLCDTPGMMVGPDVEATALVRHCSRLFVTGANVSVPMVSIVLRKAYGLGAQAMMGGSMKAPLACVAWPTGEFGGMGLEGAVRLGFRRELDSEPDEVAREQLLAEMVERAYANGKATSIASWFEIDDVIDPADSRRWISAILESAPPVERTGRRRPNVDTW
jgi:acetyl-CoA carboxylase carboxyltransferase component